MNTIIFLFFFVITPTLFADYQIIKDESDLVIETPALSKRKMVKLRLENGLEAILISDPDTPQSGAALAVCTGHWDDPEDRPGMAHFVEHMLFLGTEEYPEEEGYSRYLHEHGGQNNAFTMSDRTVYMFSVNNNGFSEALDRFGQFFIAPLFNPSGVDRECKAIHQEFCKDIPLDMWRLLYVKKEVANPKHPFHRFCIGNQETLAKISQDELKQWYHKHYSANLMHLVIYSSLDLSDLEREVVELFSSVHSHECLSPDLGEAIYLDRKDKMIAISPVQDLQLLELSWELPRFYGQEIETHSDKLLSHVLGHEGATSLLAQLKRENLADSLSSASARAGKGQCFLNLSIQLTSKGIREYETVIKRCFEAIASLKQSGIPRFIFDEVQQMELLNYRFQSRQDVFPLVIDYVMRSVDEPLETFPQKTSIPTVFAPEKMQELIEVLIPQNCQLTLIASPALTKMKPTQKERWLGVDYTTVAIPYEKIAAWSQVKPHKEISIPRPNPFIPKNYSIQNSETEKAPFLPKPTLVTDTDFGKIYACSDDRFQVPEIHWTLMLKTPFISDADYVNRALTDLYCHAVNENLNVTAYEAAMAGLSYSLQPKQGGIELTITGFSDKAANFLQIILKTLKTTQPTQKQFKFYRELFTRHYQNRINETPIAQGRELLWSILFKEYAGPGEKGKVIGSISYKQMERFCQDLFQECYIEGMLYGNGSIEVAKQINLNSKPYLPSRHSKIEMAIFPHQTHPSVVLLPTHHPANALILTADCGEFSFKRRAAQDILIKGLQEPFFSELRTKQQTAYLIANWAEEFERHLYSFFAIQSSSHEASDLLARSEAFLESSIQNLSGEVIPKKRFKAIQSSFIHKLEHPAENLHKMGNLLNLLAFDYDGDFEWLNKRIQAFKSLTYEEFESIAKEFLSKQTNRLLVIGVNGPLSSKKKIAYPQTTTPKKLRREISYKGRDRGANF